MTTAYLAHEVVRSGESKPLPCPSTRSSRPCWPVSLTQDSSFTRANLPTAREGLKKILDLGESGGSEQTGLPLYRSGAMPSAVRWGGEVQRIVTRCLARKHPACARSSRRAALAYAMQFARDLDPVSLANQLCWDVCERTYAGTTARMAAKRSAGFLDMGFERGIIPVQAPRWTLSVSMHDGPCRYMGKAHRETRGMLNRVAAFCRTCMRTLQELFAPRPQGTNLQVPSDA